MSYNPSDEPSVGRSEEERTKIDAQGARRAHCDLFILWFVIIALVFTAIVDMFGLPLVIEVVGIAVEYILLVLGRYGSVIVTAFLYLVAIIAPLFVFTFVHEMGHAIFGALVGFRIRFFQMGRFVFRYNNEKWHLKRIGPDEPKVLGAVAPTASNPANITRRTLIMIAGGPIASLLFMLATITLFVAKRLWYSALFIIPTGLVVIFTAITVLDVIVPKLFKAAGSDGQNIKVLLGGGAEAVRLATLYMVNTANATGAHPRDWNYDLLKQAAEGPCRSLRHFCILDLAYTAALSHQDFDLAGTYVDSIQEYVNPDAPRFDPAEVKDILKNLIYLDVAFFEAFYRDDPVRARRWFEQTPIQISGQNALKRAEVRAEAAILLAGGHYLEAIEKAQEGKYEMEEGKYFSGSHVWRNEELDTLIAKAWGRI